MVARELHQTIVRLLQARDWTKALPVIDSAVRLEPRNPLLLIHRAHCLLALGRPREACECAASAQTMAGSDPAMLAQIGGLFSFGNDQRRALAAYNQAVALAPDNPQYIFNRATVRRFMGQLDAAETDYNRVVALRPDDFEAYINRSELRVQTASNNHTRELEGLIAGRSLDWRSQSQLRYALAKEYEDLGEYDRSFEHLRRGAAVRREHLRYEVANDVATADWLIQTFRAAGADAVAGACEDAPIFIVGLPRSGSTLVERILGSHPQVASAGELNCLALAVVAAVRRRSGREAMSRREMVELSADIDFAALGRDYLDRAHATASLGARFTDKMPLNYLYCGLIRRALPNARIVHVRRDPMAACYAMFKTLFKDAYPFSYDLTEIGHYYVAYRRLMEFWRSSMADSLYEIRYEDLVADQQGQTRRLLEFCGLEWDDACADFHRNPAPTMTASAAQVRRPIYDSSVAQWRHYERQLAGLRAQLEAAGISV